MAHLHHKMDHFQDIFTPPASPTHEYNLREDVLNQIRGMEDGERRDVRAQQFMNQFQGEQQMHDRSKGLLVEILKVILQ